MKQENVVRCRVCSQIIKRDLIMERGDKDFPEELYKRVVDAGARTPFGGYFRQVNKLEFVLKELEFDCSCNLRV